MTTLLAFDTATASCSVALWRNGEICGHAEKLLNRGHAEALFPMIGEVLDTTGTRYADLDGLAVTVGPGSFTGIRIGLAAARGIALAAKIPAFGATTTEVIAQAVPDAECDARELLVVLDSKRRDPYYQLFDCARVVLSLPTVGSPEEIAENIAERSAPVLLAGDGTQQIEPHLIALGCDVFVSNAPPRPQSRVLASLAACRWPPDEDALPLAPIYIRRPDTTGPGRQSETAPPATED